MNHNIFKSSHSVQTHMQSFGDKDAQATRKFNKSCFILKIKSSIKVEIIHIYNLVKFHIQNVQYMYTNNYINTLLRADATRMRQLIKALIRVNPSCREEKKRKTVQPRFEQSSLIVNLMFFFLRHGGSLQ